MTSIALTKARSYAKTYSLKFLEHRHGVVHRRVLEGDVCPELHANDVMELQVISMAIALKSVLVAGL